MEFRFSWKRKTSLIFFLLLSLYLFFVMYCFNAFFLLFHFFQFLIISLLLKHGKNRIFCFSFSFIFFSMGARLLHICFLFFWIKKKNKNGWINQLTPIFFNLRSFLRFAYIFRPSSSFLAIKFCKGIFWLSVFEAQRRKYKKKNVKDAHFGFLRF